MCMEVRTVVRERVLSKRFATKSVFGGDVERKGTGDVDRCRVVAVGSVGRGSRGGYRERIPPGAREKSNHVGRGVLRSCTNLVLEHSFFAVPEQILVVSSIENIQEGTIWMALPLVEIVVAEVAEIAEDKSRVHVYFS